MNRRIPAASASAKAGSLAEAVSSNHRPEDHQRAARPVQLRIEPPDQPVAPQDRHRVVPEGALRQGLVDLPDVVEAEQRLGPPAGADRVERGQEGRLIGRRRPDRRPGGRQAAGFQLGQDRRVLAERELRRPPALDPHVDDRAVGETAIAPLAQRRGTGLELVHIRRIDPCQPCQTDRRDGLAGEHVVRFGLVDIAQRGRGRDRLGQGVDPFEPVPPGDHRLARPATGNGAQGRCPSVPGSHRCASACSSRTSGC